MTPRTSNLLRRLSETAPVVTILLLLGLPQVLPNHTVYDPRTGEHHEQIKAAIEQFPYTIGLWVGTEVDVPVEASQLLRPNAILSRRYTRLPNGPALTVVLVHCSDTRDLQGHYPPNCYPAAGWQHDPAIGPRGRAIPLEAGDELLGVQEYRYIRLTDRGSMTGLRIYNFFILPDGTMPRRMDDIYKRSARRSASIQGAAQIQMVMSTELPEEIALEAAGELLQAMRPLLTALSAADE